MSSAVFDVPIPILANCLGGHLICLIAIVLVSRSHAPIQSFTAKRRVFFNENPLEITADTISGLAYSLQLFKLSAYNIFLDLLPPINLSWPLYECLGQASIISDPDPFLRNSPDTGLSFSSRI